MKTKTLNTIGILMVIMALFIGACGASTPLTPPDKVNVQLSWFHGVEYAGFYSALEKGYYAEENIEVTLNPGGPEINPIDEVLNGNAQFGIVSGDSLIIARTSQQNLVAVATIFRNNPLAITSLSKDNIVKPGDLIGKTIGTYSADLSDYFDLPFQAFISRTELDRESMKFVVLEDFQGANDIKAGRMDAMSSMFATDQLVMTRQAGDEINLIYYKDYGVDLYINPIVVTDEYRQSDPDLIARFIKATFKGYQYAIENPEEVAGFAVKYDPSLDLSYQQDVMKAQIPFIDTGDAPIGSMDENVWKTTQEILLEFGLISTPIDLSTIYTNQFIAP
ncbi:MAG: ABC transporter substrate-binding protein [Anaerolineales bacterium]|nr:ABC transporter substrate-binding protein [Anaerolineales bacterium]